MRGPPNWGDPKNPHDKPSSQVQIYSPPLLRDPERNYSSLREVRGKM